MKVLQINSFFSVGGPPRIMNGIYTTLKENAHDCLIAAARERILFPEDSIRIGTPIGVNKNAVLARIFDNDGFNAKYATKQLINQIKAYNPDVIQIHNLHGYFINIELLFDYIRSSNIPVVWTLHDCWSLTGHCAYFSFVNCNKWKEQCFNCPQRKEYPSSILLDRSIKNYKDKEKCFSGIKNMVIVTPSKWLASFIPDSILKEYPVKVIYNGIDLESFHKSESKILTKHHLENKKILLGVAQNWKERKGLEDFIKLSAMLDDSYKVVLIGLTEEQKNSLPDSVLGLTRTENIEELVDWYSSAYMFVNLTYQDNFPTVNIEALACGTPVLTYNTGGSVEAIDDKCGWVVPQGDLDSVVRTIHNVDERDVFAENAMKRASLFSRKSKYLEYIKLYEEIVSRSI